MENSSAQSSILKKQPDEKVSTLQILLQLVSQPAGIQVSLVKPIASSTNLVYLPDINSHLLHLSHLSMHHLSIQEPARFLECLKKSDYLIHQAQKHKIEIAWELQVQCYVNIGLFYGRIGLKEEMVQFLDKAIAFKQWAGFKVHAECCVALSEMGKHHEAYLYSRSAIDISWKNLVQLLINLYSQLIRINTIKKKRFFVYISEGLQQSETQVKILKHISLVKEVHDRLKEMHQVTNNAQETALFNCQKACGNLILPPPDIQFIIDGFSNLGKLMMKFNIINIVQLGYLNKDEIRKQCQNYDIISEDFIFQTVFFKYQARQPSCQLLLLLSRGQVYSRTKHCQQKMDQYFGIVNQQEREYMLTKAVFISYTYFPHSIPFVSQIIFSFKKNYALNQQSIQESDEYEKTKKIKLKQIFLKPILGIQRSEFLIPMVRFPSFPPLFNSYIQLTMTQREKKTKKQVLEPLYNKKQPTYLSYQSRQIVYFQIQSPSHQMTQSQEILKKSTVSSQQDSPRSFNTQKQAIESPRTQQSSSKIYFFDKNSQNDSQRENPDKIEQQSKKFQNINQLKQIYQNQSDIKKTIGNFHNVFYKSESTKTSTKKISSNSNSSRDFKKMDKISISNKINILINKYQLQKNV